MKYAETVVVQDRRNPKKKKHYIDLRKAIVRKQRHVNFIIGPRSMGKTYATVEWCVEKAIEDALNGNNEKKFLYIRRQKIEIDEVDDFFKDMHFNQKFKEYMFMQRAKRLFFAEKVSDPDDAVWIQIGVMKYLSNVRNIKSSQYPDYDKMIFDEWLPEESVVFLKKEPEKFFNILETTFRDREDPWQVFLLANSSFYYNPYFSYKGIHPDLEKEFTFAGDILVFISKNPLFEEQRKNTPIGRLTEGTDYGKFAGSNMFTDITDKLIEQKSTNAHNIAIFKYMGYPFGVWEDKTTGFIYFSDKFNPTLNKKFGFHSDDYDFNYVSFKAIHNTPIHRKLMKALLNNSIRFTSNEVKALSQEPLAKIGIS